MSTQAIAQKLLEFSRLHETEYERTWYPDFYQNTMRDHWPTVIIAVIVYLIFCYVGPMIMKDRKAFDLKGLLAVWNFFLATFSFIGFFRTMPFLLSTILTVGFQDSICIPPRKSYGMSTIGCWSFLFIVSKLPELIDTVFIVLRKKPLIFLHWYHHVTVLLYCWHSYSTESASGLYFIAMNYGVHAIMYFYYGCQAINCVPKNFPAYLITFAQISQMFVGTFICCSGWYFREKGVPCHNDFYNLVAGALMYGSYLYLFMEFAFKRYLGGSKPAKKGKKAE